MKTKLLLLLLFSFTANAADLSTTFSSTYSKVSVNNTITYTGSVVNKGVDTASNEQLLFYMPPKNVNIGNLSSGCSNTNIKIICSIGELNVGDNATRTVSVFYTKKGANLVSVNAVTDSNDTNYSNNFTRLTTNVTTSTNMANAPLIPNLSSAKVTPTSIFQGNAFIFHTFNSAGSYTISAIANDTANASSTTISKTVNVSNVVVTPPATSTTTSYTKIASGSTDWACTKDNKTGLIWNGMEGVDYFA